MALLSHRGMNTAVVQYMRNRFEGVIVFATPPVTTHLTHHRSVEWQGIQHGSMDQTPVVKAGVPDIPEKMAGYGISPFNLENLASMLFDQK